MAYIETIEPEQAQGELKAIYDQVIQQRGKVAEVLKLHSLNPKSLQNHLDLYMTIMFGRSPLKRAVREMIAVVVSAANQCEYCQVHHAAALNHFWKDEARVMHLRQDYKSAQLSDAELALADYAWQMTKSPDEDHGPAIERMRKVGWSDRAILDAALVVAYFNFVNRLVLGLGAHLEEDACEGFHYD
ncbi:MAG: peroxidase [Gammaproteobacteria bacterium]|nr:MAG: peroxidase [Gammaproteobacteria bacterium]